MQVRKQYLDLDMEQQFQIGKGVHQGCILSPWLFNLYSEYIMWNARLDEAQTGLKIAGGNINNLRYADDTTLMAESEEEIKSLLMKVKEESEKAELKLSIQKTNIMASGLITPWQIGETWKQEQIFFSWAPKSLQVVTAATTVKDAFSWEGLWQTREGKAAQSCPTLCNPMEFSRPEYWSG